ncbi:MAG: o-succinylbenzoate synthase [Acidimicrobiaceae bacterium]
MRLPLRRPFATAHGMVVHRSVLLVRVIGEDGEGWGECAAEEVPTYWYESVESACSVIPMLAVGSSVSGHPMARAALEMAQLDASLRAQGVSLASHLGGTRDKIDATATAGFEDDVTEFVEAGYRSLKLKVAPDHLPPPLPISLIGMQLDANGSFATCPELLDDLDELQLVLIEQPLGADDLTGHAALAERLQTPVCLDESISSLGALDSALALGAVDIACIKASRLGGLVIAKEAQELCVAAGVGAKVGGMLETGIGRAAALALASLPGFTLPADLSASDRYWEHDITPPFVLDEDGRLPVPTGPGLGVDIRMDVVEHYTVSIELIPLN